MKNTLKKLLSLFLVLTMTIGIAPLSGFVGLELPEWNLFDFSVETEAESFEWSLNEDGTVLRISNIDGFYDQLDGYYEAYSGFGEWYAYFGFLGAIQQTILSAGMPTGIKEIELSEGSEYFSVVDGALYVTINNKNLLVFYPGNKNEKAVVFGAEDIFTPYSFINCRNLKVSISDEFTENTIAGYRRMLDIYVEYGMISEIEAAAITDEMIIESLMGSVFVTNTAESFTVSDTNKYLSSENGVLYNKDKSSVIKFPIDSDIDEISIESFPESDDFVGLVAYPAFCSFAGGTIDFHVGDIMTGNTLVYNEELNVHVAEFGIRQLIDIFKPIADSSYFVDVMYMYILVMGEKVCSDGNTSVLEEYNNIINYFKTLPNDRLAKNINNAEKCEGHHEYVSEVTKEPTCVDDGEVTYKCIHCDKTYTETIPASKEKHEYEEISRSEPTCIEDGVITYTCKYCNKTYTETIPASADKHDYSVYEEVSSTCLNQGYTIYKCSYCNDTYKETKPLNDHTAGEWEIVTDATTETEGEKVKKCTVCGTVLETAVIPTISIITGYCGENVTWKLDIETGVLTISGEGEMYDYDDWANNAPWYNNRSAIKTVIVKDSVTSIGDKAFDSCYNLTSVTISDSVESIGGCAFSYCDSLTSVTIPDSVTYIGDYAFIYCDNLTSITVDAGNEYYSSDEYGVLFNKDKTLLICCPTEKEGAYTIPDSVTSIVNCAFHFCRSLISVTIPDSVTIIGDDAFFNCVSLTSIIIPDSVTSIGDYAFGYCVSLTSVTIGNSVTSIGDYAFGYCESLTSVTIPDSVTSIGDYAFRGCESLTSITVDAENEYYSSDKYGVLFNKDKTLLICCPVEKEGDYTIPDSVTSIGDYAFGYCNSLTSVTIGNSVTTIGDAAFDSCYNLTSVTIPDSVVIIGDDAFFSCGSLTLVTIPDSVTSIGDSAFSVCGSLTSVTIGKSVTSIGDYAFGYCESLTAVTIGNSVISIGEDAFCGCESLADVYYIGTEKDWSKIKFGEENECLLNATIHYEPPVCKHTPADAVEENRVKSDCITEGSYDSVVYCSKCNTELSRETKSIPLANHKWSAWEVTAEPTMIEKGTKVRTCSVCKETDEAEIPATGITVTVTDAKGKVIEEKIIEGDLTEISFGNISDGEYTVSVSQATYTTRNYLVSSTNGKLSLGFKLSKKGDVTGDDKLNTIDVARANSHAKGVSTLTDYSLACADVTGDGKVNTIDVARINSHAKGVSHLW